MHRGNVVFFVGFAASSVAACGDSFKGGGASAAAGSAGSASASAGTSGASHASAGHAGVHEEPAPSSAGEAGEESSGGAGDEPSAGTGGQLGVSGGAGVSGSAGVAGHIGVAGGGGMPSSVTCQTMADCASAQNCVAHACVPALVSCAAQKNSFPDSKDGVYWLAGDGAARRVYCDMAQSAELCSEVMGEHQGRTRDKSTLAYTMTSVLLLSDGVCKLWDIHGSDSGYPFGGLEAIQGVPAASTCRYLGFAADGALGSCNYGSNTGYTNCGFTKTPLERYGNSCASCTPDGAGTFDHWVLQGQIFAAGILSSKSGSIFTTCKTQ